MYPNENDAQLIGSISTRTVLNEVLWSATCVERKAATVYWLMFYSPRIDNSTS